MGASERAGLADRRPSVVSQARGVTLELGAGTGLNLEHYPADVTELVLTEPDEHMVKRLRRRVSGQAPSPMTSVQQCSKER